MNKINNKSMKFLPAALIVMSLLLATVTCAKVIIFRNDTANISINIQKAVNAGVLDDEKIKEFQGIFTDAAKKLKKKSIFESPKPQQSKANPVKIVDGILGSAARINEKWYEVGDSIGEAKLISVDSAEVTILWNGKEIKFSPISAPTTYAVKTKPDHIEDTDTYSRLTEKSDLEESRDPASDRVEQRNEFAWIGIKLSPQLRAKFLEGWNKMSDEQKAMARKRWESMPQGQKQMFVNQMEMQNR